MRAIILAAGRGRRINILSKNYVATGESKEALEARYAANEATIMKIIGDETIKQSEKNFLIDKIVGIKDEDTDIDAQIAAALKAEKIVKDLDDLRYEFIKSYIYFILSIKYILINCPYIAKNTKIFVVLKYHNDLKSNHYIPQSF